MRKFERIEEKAKVNENRLSIIIRYIVSVKQNKVCLKFNRKDYIRHGPIC